MAGRRRWSVGVAAAHQAFSANLYTLPGDVFPRGAVGSVIGIGGMLGGIGGMVMAKSVGQVLETDRPMSPIFAVCGCIYLLAVLVIHLLTPKMTPVQFARGGLVPLHTVTRKRAALGSRTHSHWVGAMGRGRATGRPSDRPVGVPALPAADDTRGWPNLGRLRPSQAAQDRLRRLGGLGADVGHRGDLPEGARGSGGPTA